MPDLDYSTATAGIRRQALLDLVQRARGGLTIHLILWSLMGAMGNIAHELPVFFWGIAAGFAIDFMARLFFEPRIAELSIARPLLAKSVFLSLLLANPALWGAIGAATTLSPQLHSAAAWVLLVVTGIAASGGMSLSFDPAVRRSYAALAILPATACVALTESGEGLFKAVAAAIFLLYIYRASRVVHDDYWSAVQSRVELEERALKLEYLSATDALTQVSNRMHFDKRLTTEWARARRNTPTRSVLTVIMVDIDHFKNVNDAHGHPFGDQCLQAVAATLRLALKRPGDLLARFGGEEFIAMLPNTDAVGAAVVAVRMHAAVREIAIEHLGTAVPLACSIGVHTADTMECADPSVAISNADRALYAAKREGRDRIVVFEEHEATSR